MVETEQEQKWEEASRIISRIDEDKSFITGDDGYVVFWPSENRGAFQAWHLRLIADELDKRNESWDKQVQEYYNK